MLINTHNVIRETKIRSITVNVIDFYDNDKNKHGLITFSSFGFNKVSNNNKNNCLTKHKFLESLKSEEFRYQFKELTIASMIFQDEFVNCRIILLIVLMMMMI